MRAILTSKRATKENAVQTAPSDESQAPRPEKTTSLEIPAEENPTLNLTDLKRKLACPEISRQKSFKSTQTQSGCTLLSYTFFIIKEWIYDYSFQTPMRFRVLVNP